MVSEPSFGSDLSLRTSGVRNLLVGLALLTTVAVAGLAWLLTLPQRSIDRIQQSLAADEVQTRSAFFSSNGVSPELLLVVARLDETVTGTYANDRSWLGINLGRTQLDYRLPVTIQYGVPLTGPDPVRFRIVADRRRIEAIFPELDVASVEPNLAGLEVQVEVGWARLESMSGKDIEREFYERVMEDVRGHARTQLVELVRETARQSLAGFVRVFLVDQNAWGTSGFDQIEVRFADETRAMRPPGSVVIAAPAESPLAMLQDLVIGD